MVNIYNDFVEDYWFDNNIVDCNNIIEKQNKLDVDIIDKQNKLSFENNQDTSLSKLFIKKSVNNKLKNKNNYWNNHYKNIDKTFYNKN